jgi:hypothetical protein
MNTTCLLIRQGRVCTDSKIHGETDSHIQSNREFLIYAGNGVDQHSLSRLTAIFSIARFSMNYNPFTSSLSSTLNLTEPEKKVLRSLRQHDNDGFSLQKSTGLADDEFGVAIAGLISKSLVNFQGTPQGPGLNDAYFWVKPELRGTVDALTGRLNA